MSWIPCECGARISDVRVPAPNQGTLLRQQDEEQAFGLAVEEIMAFLQAVYEGRRTEWRSEIFTDGRPYEDIPTESVVSDILWMRYTQVCLSTSECSNCGRLYVQNKNGENTYLGYAPDKPGYHSILVSEREKEKEQI